MQSPCQEDALGNNQYCGNEIVTNHDNTRHFSTLKIKMSVYMEQDIKGQKI